MDMDRLFAHLKEFDALRDGDKIERGTVERIQPQFSDSWPEDVHPAVARGLEALGRPRPYRHQFEAINEALLGTDLVIESPTASGKTLSFAVPMLDALVREPNSHALLVYPTKALALDQREAVHELCEQLSGVRKIESWPYDGNTPKEERDAIRQAPPAILTTNPEMLNMTFLGHREIWERNGFLQGLKYIVIDEMHEYRGFFGGNMALLLRRFLLHLRRLGVSPRVVMATATCANPTEHAEALSGRAMRLIRARDSLRPLRHFAFINADIPDFQYRDIFRLRIQKAALACLKADLQTLVFCPSKKFLEEAFRRCRSECEDLGLDPEKLEMFHADLRPDRKEDIQRRIKAGQARVIFSTNALELGMDIGGMDGVILAGFPTNIMSAWQQMGRAGRGWEKDAFVLFYAMNDPIDRFFVGNLDAFLTKPYDRLVVDPDNEELIKNHLPSLIEESPDGFVNTESEVLGSTFYRKAIESQAASTPGYKPQSNLTLRGDFGQVFKLKHGSQEIGQISNFRRFREAYLGAVFPFLGNRYRVHAHEEDAIVLEESEHYLRTDPGFYTFEQISEFYEGVQFGEIASIYYGKLDILTNFTGYSLIDERSNEKKATQSAGETLRESNRHALWIHMLEQDELAREGLGALEHILRVGAMFVIPADRFDANTLSRVRGAANLPTAFYYETYAGGIGVAKNLFLEWQTALRKGIEVARHCACAKGCPECIEPPKVYADTNINKHLGIELAERVLEAASNGPTSELRNGVMVPVQRGHQTIAQQPPPKSQPATPALTGLVQAGESESVEFKSTLRVNLHTGDKDTRMEDAVLKTVAAFLNTDGGTLLIGVSDGGELVGIASDQFRDEDSMSRHLTSLVRDRIEASANTLLHQKFEQFGSGKVLRVTCDPSPQPVFVKPHGSFFIRAGSTSEELSGRHMMEYANWRFGS